MPDDSRLTYLEGRVDEQARNWEIFQLQRQMVNHFRSTIGIMLALAGFLRAFS